MGPVQHQDFRVRPSGHQFLQHLAAPVAWIADLAVELAIGEGTRTAFTKLGVRFGIERAAPLPETKGVGAALLDRLAPLEQQRFEAHLGQHQGSEIPTGPSANHHRAGQVVAEALAELGRRLPGRLVTGLGAGSQVGIAAKPLQQLGL